jgi:hypothetical protein
MSARDDGKIAMLNDSVRCLNFGLLSLLPAVGLLLVLLALSTDAGVFWLLGFFPLAGFPFAVMALWIGGRVRRKEKQFWNAAKPLRIWGIICGGTGAVMGAVVAGLIFYNLDDWIVVLSR